MAQITVRKNGSYLVEGDDVTVVDWNGREYPLAKRVTANGEDNGPEERVLPGRG